MKNFNWEEFKEGILAVNCNTEEKAKDFINKALERKYKWKYKTTTDDQYHWNTYNNNTCYDNVEKELDYTTKSWYTDTGEIEYKKIKVIEWEIEPQTEFTYQEVIAKIKDGECYECTDIENYYVESISRKGNEIIFKGEISNGVGIDLVNQLFKIQESKQKYEIYIVEDNPCGAKIKFKSSLTSAKLNPYSMVVCRAKDKDDYYGRIIELSSKQLTKEEYNELPSIVGLVN